MVSFHAGSVLPRQSKGGSAPGLEAPPGVFGRSGAAFNTARMEPHNAQGFLHHRDGIAGHRSCSRRALNRARHRYGNRETCQAFSAPGGDPARSRTVHFGSEPCLRRRRHGTARCARRTATDSRAYAAGSDAPQHGAAVAPGAGSAGGNGAAALVSYRSGPPGVAGMSLHPTCRITPLAVRLRLCTVNASCTRCPSGETQACADDGRLVRKAGCRTDVCQSRPPSPDGPAPEIVRSTLLFLLKPGSTTVMAWPLRGSRLVQ